MELHGIPTSVGWDTCQVNSDDRKKIDIGHLGLQLGRSFFSMGLTSACYSKVSPFVNRLPSLWQVYWVDSTSKCRLLAGMVSVVGAFTQKLPDVSAPPSLVPGTTTWHHADGFPDASLLDPSQHLNLLMPDNIPCMKGSAVPLTFTLSSWTLPTHASPTWRHQLLVDLDTLTSFFRVVGKKMPVV